MVSLMIAPGAPLTSGRSQVAEAPDGMQLPPMLLCTFVTDHVAGNVSTAWRPRERDGRRCSNARVDVVATPATTGLVSGVQLTNCRSSDAGAAAGTAKLAAFGVGSGSGSDAVEVTSASSVPGEVVVGVSWYKIGNESPGFMAMGK